MLMLKVCHACDGILGEIEVGEDLTHDVPDSIMNVIDNVAYTLCPDCLRLLESESGAIYH